MDLFVFSSKNLTNIWAGLGAGLWAVSQREPRGMKELATKSQRMRVGSLGVLYCSATKSLTMPFVVYSNPDLSGQVDNVWPETWVMPFRIHALGTPDRQLHKDQAAQILPAFKVKGTTNISRVFNVAATAVFVPSPISPEDWQLLIEHLAG